MMARTWCILAVVATSCRTAELEPTLMSESGNAADGVDASTTASGTTSTGETGSDAESTSTDDESGSTGSDMPALDWREQVIYLVMPDRFVDGDPGNDELAPAGCFDPADPRKYHGGDLQGVTGKLDYLGELGVTTLWITPVYAQSPDRCGYHGYWADFADPDDGAIQPTLGSIDDLVALAEGLHAADRRLVLDMVVNHSGIAGRVVEQHPDWFHDPEHCARVGPPEVFCPIGGSPLPDFAQEQPVVAAYLDAMSVDWIDRAPIDGVRMDTVNNEPESYWADSWIPAVKAARPDLFVVGEVFETGATEKLVPYLDAGFDSLFNFPLMAEMVHVFAAGGSVNPLASRVAEQIELLGQARTRELTTFVDNHDLPRFASVVNDAEPLDAHRRHLLALGALFTLPGIPMLYYGDEIGMLGGADPDGRGSPRSRPARGFWTASSTALSIRWCSRCCGPKTCPPRN